MMPVNVPTSDEFAALTARVEALEQAKPPPTDPPPATGAGVQAKRIADGIELLGVNTFSSLDEHNLWGSYPADYRPEQVVKALSWITGASGFRLRIREYHYTARYDMQREWLAQIQAALPGTQTTVCIGANGGVDDVPTMLELLKDRATGVCWVEGLNEPNTDFGAGQVPVEITLAIQQALGPGDAMGPSIVAGTPHPEGWIEGYCGGSLDEINGLLNYGNGHYYPPINPDLPGTGSSVSEYVGGLWTAYAQHPVMLTEFHPTLYSGEGNAPSGPEWEPERDAYYTLLTLFRCAKIGVTGLWWYALFDYGTAYKCGLFPTDASNPRPVAHALRDLCELCADPGENRRSFEPGRLEVTVAGLPEGADWDLYQTSAGAFIVPLWRAAEAGVVPVPVKVTLGAEAQLTEWDVMTGERLQSRAGRELTSELEATVRLILVQP